MVEEVRLNPLAVMPGTDEQPGGCNEVTAEETAGVWRAEARLPGPPTTYEVKLAAALDHLVSWARAGKFRPLNEEDVQCFLYHALVLQFADATRIRTKLTHGSPGVVVGDQKVGGMHFPDLIIGESDSDPDAIYIEIKVRAKTRKAFHQACLADVKKLAQHHNGHRQFFVLYDCDPEVVYLSDQQSRQLRAAAGKGCTVWHYPYALNEDGGKGRAEKAIATMRAQGLDFNALARSNARKAQRTKLAKAKAALAAAKAAASPSVPDGSLSATASPSDKLTRRQAKPLSPLKLRQRS